MLEEDWWTGAREVARTPGRTRMLPAPASCRIRASTGAGGCARNEAGATLSPGTRLPTTHVGSLPRPQEVVDVVFAEDRGVSVDRA